MLSNFRSKETDLIIYVFHFPVTRLCLLSVRFSVLRGWTFSKVPWLLAEINRVAWLLLALVLTIPCAYPSTGLYIGNNVTMVFFSAEYVKHTH